MFVKKVESNIRIGCDQELSRCTVVVGPNMSGKNTLLDSVVLPLTGSTLTPGVGKSPQFLKQLVPPKENALRSKVILSDGTPITWEYTFGSQNKTWSHGGSKPPPYAVLYADEVRDALMGNGERLKEIILRAAKTPLVMHEILYPLGEDDQKLLTRLMETTDLDGIFDDKHRVVQSREFTGPEISAVIKATASEVRSVKAQVKSHEAASSDVVEALTEQEDKELSRLLEAYQRHQAMPKDINSASARLGVVLREEAAVRARYEAVFGLDDDRLQDLESTAKLLDDAASVIHEFLCVYRQDQSVSSMRCFLCGSNFDPSTLESRYEQVRKMADDSLANAAEAKKTHQQVRELSERLTALAEERKSLETLITQGQVHFHQVDYERMRELKDRRDRWDRYRQAVDQLPELEAKAERLKTIQGVLKESFNGALLSAVAFIERRANDFLPKTVRVRIDPDGKSVFVSRGDGPYKGYRAISGAEQVEAMLAIAAATIPKTAPPVKLIVINEAVLDTKMAKLIMKSIAVHVEKGTGFTQALVAMVSLTGKEPEGWTKIDLGPRSSGSKKKAPKVEKEEVS